MCLRHGRLSRNCWGFYITMHVWQGATCACVYACMLVPWSVCEDQTTTCCSQFFPSHRVESRDGTQVTFCLPNHPDSPASPPVPVQVVPNEVCSPAEHPATVIVLGWPSVSCRVQELCPKMSLIC